MCEVADVANVAWISKVYKNKTNLGKNIEWTNFVRWNISEKLGILDAAICYMLKVNSSFWVDPTGNYGAYSES